MGRKRGIWCTLLIVLSACGTVEIAETQQNVEVSVRLTGMEMSTRATDPDETLISSLQLLVYDENGLLEERLKFPIKVLNDNLDCRLTLLKGKKYNFYACANMDIRLKTDKLDELKEIRYHLVYPDDYRTGIPMAGMVEGIIADPSSEIEINLKRLMSKISLCIDRGGLSEGIGMRIVSVKIGNCPRSVAIFADSRVENEDDCFPAGFTRSEQECGVLNMNSADGVSGALSLYMLENMQGEFSPTGIRNDSDKVFEEHDIRSRTCSFLELGIDYTSPSCNSLSKPLIYRFYLGNSRNNLDIERNCHYRITVIPEDDGLADEGWRIDKSGLVSNDSDIFFSMIPSGYILASVGEQLHVRCCVRPESAPFDIGIEELEEDRTRGIYDYKIDDDGKGVILSLKSRGTGILYMSAGPPVNESGMLVLEVTDIKN